MAHILGILKYRLLQASQELTLTGFVTYLRWNAYSALDLSVFNIKFKMHIKISLVRMHYSTDCN